MPLEDPVVVKKHGRIRVLPDIRSCKLDHGHETDVHPISLGMTEIVLHPCSLGTFSELRCVGTVRL